MNDGTAENQHDLLFYPIYELFCPKMAIFTDVSDSKIPNSHLVFFSQLPHEIKPFYP